MKINLFSKIIFILLLAFTVNSFVYFSFGNLYSSTVLNYADFENQFHSGIYQYRILSGYFLIWIYDFLSSLNIDYQIFKLKFFNTDAEPKMYLSFFILNTIFLILSSIVLVFITETKNFIATQSEKILMISVAIFAISLSQFVIVPYDVSSYFFLLFFFFFLLKYLEKDSALNLIILLVILIISTFNRESSALSLSLAATLLYAKFGLKKKMYLPIIFLFVSFIAVYLGMRLWSESFSTNDGNLLEENFSQPKNFLGILFWMIFFIFTLILAKDRKGVRLILIFHVLSFPYILMCFYTGILYEVRLYIPIFLTSLILSRTEFSRFD
ncbi:hypothetical protein [Kaistella yonginensis]|uniref:hypothetical protein n=1 Tax=Kaistella yonginensis TaxID=658267 RepID=UPI0025B28ADA|nr:hypothetical protein [Kaistella yonginensis]MDN3606603.1 hypothetical protein [Kaistella yonginensis]